LFIEIYFRFYGGEDTPHEGNQCVHCARFVHAHNHASEYVGDYDSTVAATWHAQEMNDTKYATFWFYQNIFHSSFISTTFSSASSN